MYTKLKKNRFGLYIAVLSFCMLLLLVIKIKCFDNDLHYHGAYDDITGLEDAYDWDVVITQTDVNEYMIEGWVALPGYEQRIDLFNKQIWLKDEENNYFVIKRAKSVIKHDIATYLSDKYQDSLNYQFCGFHTEIGKSRNNKQYRVYICYSYAWKNYLIDTGESITL